jgi:3-hydroxybutyryl-CoA dehydrogenase
MKIASVSVVGSGYMGVQIAFRSAAKGFNVKIYDIKKDALAKAKKIHEKELSSSVEKKTITPSDKERIRGRIVYTTNLKEAIGDADLVIETIPEILELKRAIFEKIDQASPHHTVIATNSSSIIVSRIEDACKRPEKVLNLHFYPPISQRPMAEIMKGSKTSDETVELVKDYVKGIEMTPLMVQKESTGFLFNRVWRAIKKETLHLVDDGVASFMDVDRAWMIIFNQSVGPFGLMDMVGLDVVRDIEMVYFGESGDEYDYPPKLLLDKVEKGELGIKTGKGFYTYPNPVFCDPRWLKG